MAWWLAMLCLSSMLCKHHLHASMSSSGVTASVFRRGGPKRELFDEGGGDVGTQGINILDTDKQQLEQELEQLLQVLQAPKTGRDLSAAVWRPDIGAAELALTRRNTAQAMGFKWRKRQWLHPEEAAFLVDRADLLLFVEQPTSTQQQGGQQGQGHSQQQQPQQPQQQGLGRSQQQHGVSATSGKLMRGEHRLLSLQETFELMVLAGISMERYIVYSNLSRSGYLVMRYPSSWLLPDKLTPADVWGHGAWRGCVHLNAVQLSGGLPATIAHIKSLHQGSIPKHRVALEGEEGEREGEGEGEAGDQGGAADGAQTDAAATKRASTAITGTGAASGKDAAMETAAGQAGATQQRLSGTKRCYVPSKDAASTVQADKQRISTGVACTSHVANQSLHCTGDDNKENGTGKPATAAEVEVAPGDSSTRHSAGWWPRLPQLPMMQKLKPAVPQQQQHAIGQSGLAEQQQQQHAVGRSNTAEQQQQHAVGRSGTAGQQRQQQQQQQDRASVVWHAAEVRGPSHGAVMPAGDTLRRVCPRLKPFEGIPADAAVQLPGARATSQAFLVYDVYKPGAHVARSKRPPVFPTLAAHLALCSSRPPRLQELQLADAQAVSASVPVKWVAVEGGIMTLYELGQADLIKLL